MKKLLLTSFFSLGVVCGFAQGVISFRNTPSTLISIFGDGLIQPPAGSYYFTLLLAPSGTTDPTAFTFAAVNAQNTAVQGMLDGGTHAVPLAFRFAFEVAGWDASLGSTYNPAWLNNWQNQPGFGLSMIAEGTPGTVSQPLPIFGPNTISTGFYILAIPEPGVVALVLLGAILLRLILREKQVRAVNRLQ